MPTNIVHLTPGYYPSSSIGRPLASADIYVGIPDLDPEIVANQKTLSVQQEDGTVVAVSQPISTNAGGVPQYLGSPVTLLVEGDYSLKVNNSAGSQIYYVPSLASQALIPGNYFYPDYNETDQGAAGDGNSVFDILTKVGAVTKATMFFAHNSGAATTTYVFGTDEAITDNFNIIIEVGALLSPSTGKTLTINGPVHSLSHDGFAGPGTVTFGETYKEIYSNISADATDFYAGRGPLLVWSNPSTNSVGEVGGLQVWVNRDLTATPGADDHIAGQFYITNLNSRQHIWGLNILALQGPTGADGWVRGIEVEIADTSNSSTDPFGSDGFVQLGVDVVGHSGSTNRPTSAFRVWANDATGDKWWYEGISISRAYQYGIHFYADPGGNSDDIDAFGAVGGAAIYDNSNSEAVIKTDTTHANSVIDLGGISAGDGATYNFIRTPMDADTELILKNYADFATILGIDSGISATKSAGLRFRDQGVVKWTVEKDSANNMTFYNHATSKTVFLLAGSNDAVIIAQSKTPASAGATGTTGTIAWDADYIYICVTTDTWKRVAISTW